MSVEARELMVDVWSRWQGHLVDGRFPLGRVLGYSEHSGVFLTRPGTAREGDVAIKLIPVDQATEPLLLDRWTRSGALAETHLLPLLEWGACQLDGLPYVFVVMEYADQTLAQLLRHRALTSDETREMLPPILEALAFLHGQDWVHGRLKPANIMVVGDQLKLASDTIRAAGEREIGLQSPATHRPPEGGSSPAGDIWSLGAMLYEALMGAPPPGVAAHRGTAALPSDFPPAFREIVARCLNANPHERPRATELRAWAQGRSELPLPESSPQLVTVQPPASRSPAAPPISTSPSPNRAAAARPAAPLPAVPARKLQIGWSLLTAAVVISSLGWIALHRVGSHAGQDGGPAPAAAQAPVAPSAPLTAIPGGNESNAPLALHEEIPEIANAARRTIRGHIKVSMRASVDPDGSVSAVVTDRPGSSRYFRRLAADAALRWRFQPSGSASRRFVQIQFDFSREGTTGRAVPAR